MRVDPVSGRNPHPDPLPLGEGGLLLRLQVEDFLYEEAALLDQWRLDDWLALFTEDCSYVVPTNDLPEGDPARDSVFIDDNYERLQGRVTRLKSRHAHREYPYSRTRRLVTNVRLTRVDEHEVDASASFAVYRLRMGQIAPYIGHYEYTLARNGAGFKIRSRRAVMDNETLREHGAVSIIL
ncbi:MAG TPA: aromatic-ring-hydroxylating dioxygenase subunit beta [Chloroflexota bacterium]|nr:aromatic-ring-hydroxylating dioxygenase subunit beta [Chloroflexota bacterium]